MKTPKRIVEALREIVEFGELVLRERFGGEEVERARIGIFEDGIQDGQVVAERFARGRGRNDNEIFARARRFGRGGLMRVELVDSLGAIRSGKFRANPRGHWAELRFAGGDVLDRGEDFVGTVAGRERVQNFLYGSERRLRPDGQALRCGGGGHC